MSNSTLLLFYHSMSPACEKLLNIIPKDYKNIKLLNIEEIPNLPPSITSIPCLVKEDGTTILLGKDVFDYFNKSDELEFINLSGKHSNAQFSNIDNDNLNNNSVLFSSIDAPSISEGIPEWNEENNDSLDIEKMQTERNNFDKIQNENTNN